MMCIAAMSLSAKTTKVDSLSLQISHIEQQIREEGYDIDQLQKEVLLNEKALHSAEEHIDRVNEEISNQIAASSHTIQAWGWIIAVIAIAVSIVMTIAGIVFTHYINKMRKNIIQLTTEAKKQLKQAETASDDIADQQQRINAQQQEIKTIHDATEKNVKELQKLHKDIQNNMSELYARLRREETIVLLKRLDEIPEDIENLSDILLARELNDDDYSLLLSAYHNLIERSLELSSVSNVVELREKNSKFAILEESYALLFAQHFMGKSILNPELRDLLCVRFPIFFDECFFRNDAEKSTRDFKDGLDAMEDSQQQMELLKEFISAIVRSHYSRLTELYKILLNNLSESQLEDVWDAVSKDNSNAIHFANTIKDVLSSVNPQNTTINKITAYIEETEKAETPSSPDASVQA